MATISLRLSPSVEAVGDELERLLKAIVKEFIERLGKAIESTVRTQVKGISPGENGQTERGIPNTEAGQQNYHRF